MDSLWGKRSGEEVAGGEKICRPRYGVPMVAAAACWRRQGNGENEPATASFCRLNQVFGKMVTRHLEFRLRTGYLDGWRERFTTTAHRYKGEFSRVSQQDGRRAFFHPLKRAKSVKT